MGELAPGNDPNRCACRRGRAILVAVGGQSAECEALCWLPRGHDGGKENMTLHALLRPGGESRRPRSP
eukprot:12396519-Alexandrium_andersonii.AAC.1